jgi:hypothetical protein
MLNLPHIAQPQLPHRPLTPERAAEVARLLQAIGWEPSQLVQLAIYAQMSPTRKIELMLEMSEQAMRLLRARLAAAHPDADQNALLRQHIEEYYRTY